MANQKRCGNKKHAPRQFDTAVLYTMVDVRTSVKLVASSATFWIVTLIIDGTLGLARIAGTGLRSGATPANMTSTFCKTDDDSLMTMISSTDSVFDAL